MKSGEPSSVRRSMRWIYRVLGIVALVLLAVMGLYATYRSYRVMRDERPRSGVSDAKSSSRDQQPSRVTRDDFQQFLDRGLQRHRHSAGDSKPIQLIRRDTTSGTYPQPERLVSLDDRWSSFSDVLRRGLREIEVERRVPEVTEPVFRGRTLSGDSISLSLENRQWTFLNFWASWCGPCRHEMPSLNRLSAMLPEDRFRLIGVNVKESQRTVRSFREEFRLKFPVVLDPDGSISSRYHVRAIPVTWILDPRGAVVGRIRGAVSWDQPPAKNVIRKLIRTSEES